MFEEIDLVNDKAKEEVAKLFKDDKIVCQIRKKEIKLTS